MYLQANSQNQHKCYKTKTTRSWDITSYAILKRPLIYPIKWVKSTTFKRVPKDVLSLSSFT